MTKARVNKTGYNFMYIFIFVENWILYDTIHDFAVDLEPIIIQRILIVSKIVSTENFLSYIPKLLNFCKKKIIILLVYGNL